MTRVRQASGPARPEAFRVLPILADAAGLTTARALHKLPAMRIEVNGEPHEVGPDTSIGALLAFGGHQSLDHLARTTSWGSSSKLPPAAIDWMRQYPS